MRVSLSEEETCSSLTHSSYSSGSEDSDDDKEISIKENAAHVYSELTAIRDKLHVKKLYTHTKMKYTLVGRVAETAGEGDTA